MDSNNFGRSLGASNHMPTGASDPMPANRVSNPIPPTRVKRKISLPLIQYSVSNTR